MGQGEYFKYDHKSFIFFRTTTTAIKKKYVRKGNMCSFLVSQILSPFIISKRLHVNQNKFFLSFFLSFSVCLSHCLCLCLSLSLSLSLSL